MSAGGGEDGIWRGGAIIRLGASPSCAAGSEQGIVASDEMSVSSGNLLESNPLLRGGRFTEVDGDGRAISLGKAGTKLSEFIGRRAVFIL